MLYLGLLALAGASDYKHQTYSSSISACKHGSDGVIINFKDHDSRRRLTSVAMHAGDVVDKAFTSMPSVAAHMSDVSIESYLNDPSVDSVEADCIIVLDDDALT